MSDYPVQSFIDLVSFDQSTYVIEDEIHQIKKDIESLQDKEETLRGDFEFFKTRMRDARKAVDQAELEQKELEQKEIARKEKLDHAADQREYKALTKEIETLKRNQHDHEETLLFTWNKFELAKKEYELREKESEIKAAELKERAEQKNAKMQDLQKELEGRIAQRGEKLKLVPPEWMEKYVLMRSRVSDPVVPVVRGSCSACFYHLPPQDFLELKRKRLSQCKGCYRFLYIEELEPVEQPKEPEQQEKPE